MINIKEIKKQVNEFLKDKSKKKIEIEVNKYFKVNSLINPFTLAYRKFIFHIQKWTPPSAFKNWLLSTTGMKIEQDVCIPHYIHFDPYFPELISLGKGSLIGGLSFFYTHEIKDNKLIIGRINIKEKVLCAGWTSLYPGVTVNPYVITGMKSQIRQDCPERAFVVSKDRVIKQWNDEEVEKYFGESNHDPNYYKIFKKKTAEFRKNKEMMKIKINNDGKRLNPGNEWYLSRPVLRIYYNAVFVELARIAPSSGLRKFLYRCIGAKIGKNVYIGKGTVLDHIYGDMVTIGDNVHLGNNNYIDGHSYTIAESVFGRVKIGDNTKFGDWVYVMCGVKVGKNVTVLNYSSVLKDIPDGETWAGMPAKPVEQK